MSHKVEGTFALMRLSDENKETLIKELTEAGCNVRLDNKGLNATVVCDSIDFNTARSRYNEYIYAAKKAELESRELPTTHLPSAEVLAKRTEEAAQQAAEARAATEGSLMSNPAPMTGRVTARSNAPRELSAEEAQNKFGDKQKSELGNLPANSPPPGMTEAGATAEYLEDQAARRDNVPTGGQINSGASPSEPYTPPTPEPQVMEGQQ